MEERCWWDRSGRIDDGTEPRTGDCACGFWLWGACWWEEYVDWGDIIWEAWCCSIDCWVFIKADDERCGDCVTGLCSAFCWGVETGISGSLFQCSLKILSLATRC